ncbi:hypothetical protein D3C78_1136620 [compost metagenome]
MRINLILQRIKFCTPLLFLFNLGLLNQIFDFDSHSVKGARQMSYFIQTILLSGNIKVPLLYLAHQPIEPSNRIGDTAGYKVCCYETQHNQQKKQQCRKIAYLVNFGEQLVTKNDAVELPS